MSYINKTFLYKSMYIDIMNFYKITIYTFIFIIVIILVYILYNYAKNKITYRIEPFYNKHAYEDDEFFPFFDLIETYKYSVMVYLWYKMPYYNSTVTVENGTIVLPNSYFTNNSDKSTERTKAVSGGGGPAAGGSGPAGDLGADADIKNANGIFGRYVTATDKTPEVNYTGASVILARPNIHRVNLKNFILSKGNISDFNLSVEELETIKNAYDVLYKINFWYSANKTSFYENKLIGDKLDAEKTGFEYVKYIYDPTKYNEELKSNSFFNNYINKYRTYLTGNFVGIDYYLMNNKMKLIYDIYNGDLSKMNLNYIDGCFPFETYKLDNIENPYSAYLETLNIEENYEVKDRINTFKINVISAARIIMEKVIDGSITLYSSILENTELIPYEENSIGQTTDDFFNHFFVLNALYSLYIDRYYYLDVNYYNPTQKDEIKTLSYEDYKFTGGETFTLLHADWLKGIGLNETDNSAYEHITEDGTEFSEDTPESLYFYNSGFKTTDNNGFAVAPISKLYRGLTYVKAIDCIDGGKAKQKMQDDIASNIAEINRYRESVETAIKKIKDIRINISVRKYLTGLKYDDFTGSNINNKHTITDSVSGNTDYRFDTFTASLYELLPPGLCRISKYANRDDPKDRGFGSTNTNSGDKDFDWQDRTNTHTHTEKGQYNWAKAKKDDDKVTVTVTPLFDWMGLGTGSATKEVTNKSLDTVAGKLLANKAALGYDVQWYIDVINFAFTPEMADNIGRKLIDKDYKSKYDADRVSIAKGQVNYYNAVNFGNWQDYWKFYLFSPAKTEDYVKLVSSQPTVSNDKFLNNILSAAYNDLNTRKYNLTEKEKSNKAIKEKDYYGTINDRYNKLYSQHIPELLKSCILNLQIRIDQINVFNTFINNFNDFQQINYKWEKRLNECSINKIANIVYNSNKDGSKNYTTVLNNRNNQNFNTLNKEVIRKYHAYNNDESLKTGQDDYTDDYNIIFIKSLMPVMVYFDDINNKNKTPGSNSISVYNKDVDDYVIYNKTNFRSLIDNIINYINSFIFNEILSSISTFLKNIKKGYNKIIKEINLPKVPNKFMPE